MQIQIHLYYSFAVSGVFLHFITTELCSRPADSVHLLHVIKGVLNSTPTESSELADFLGQLALNAVFFFSGERKEDGVPARCFYPSLEFSFCGTKSAGALTDLLQLAGLRPKKGPFLLK